MTDWTTSPNLNVNGAVPATAATWHCVEWELAESTVDGGVGQIDTWLDGQEIGGLHLTSVPMSDLGELSFGISFFQAVGQPAYEVWIDEVFVDTSPVGCTK